MQKGRAGTGKPGNEDRPGNRPRENFGSLLFFLKQPQQVRQEPHRVPAGRNPPDQAQICLYRTGAQKILQRFQEGRFAKLRQPRAATRQSDQLIGSQGLLQGRKRIAQQISDPRHGGYWQHR